MIANLLKIAVYPVIIWIARHIARRDWRKRIAFLDEEKMRTKSIFWISLMIGLYSMSFNHTFWWGDVVYYDAFFSEGLRFPDSFGLNVIYWVLHLFTRNIDVLLFSVAFLSTFVMLLAYREYESARPVSLLFLFFTPFFIEACQVNLKQGIACGLAALCINEIFRKRWKFAALFFLAATLFHITAAVILALTFIAVRAVSIKHKAVKLGAFALVFICFVFSNQMFAILARIASVIPVLGSKFAEYASDSGAIGQDSTGLIVIKGIPYYLITLIGFWERKKLVRSVNNYDGFLVVSVLASLSYILSFRSYWMSRIIDYYWMTDFVFLGILLYGMRSRRNQTVVKYGIGAMLCLLTFRQLLQMYPF